MDVFDDWVILHPDMTTRTDYSQFFRLILDLCLLHTCPEWPRREKLDVVICWLCGPGHAKRERVDHHNRYARYKAGSARPSSPSTSRARPTRTQSVLASPAPPASPQQSDTLPAADLVSAPLPPQSSAVVFDATGPQPAALHTGALTPGAQARAGLCTAQQVTAARELSRKRQESSRVDSNSDAGLFVKARSAHADFVPRSSSGGPASDVVPSACTSPPPAPI